MSQPPAPGPEPVLGYGFPPLPDENPTRPDRPPSVFAGCVMAWIGGVGGCVFGAALVSLAADSPALKSVAASDRADFTSSLHLVGWIFVVWSPLVILVAAFAYKGAKWAAMTLVGMAVACVLASLVGLATGSSAQGGLGLIWVLASTALVYLPPSSRRWFADMAARRGPA
jgi:hypothetical protein